MNENNNLEQWQEDYINSQANPMDNRNLDVIAKENNIGLSTLYRWRRDNQEFINSQVEARRKKYTAPLRSIAYKALANKMAKDTNAMKLFFQLAGDLIERSESRTEIITPEEKRARLAALLDKISKSSSKDEGEGTGQVPQPPTE